MDAGFEVVDTAIRPIFANAKTDDLCIFTNTSNQCVLLGTGVSGQSNSTLKVSRDCVEVFGQLNVHGQVLVDSLSSEGIWKQVLPASDGNIYYDANGSAEGSNVGIGTSAPMFKLHVVGDIYATGTHTASSDARLKKDILPLTNALDNIDMIRGYTFARADDTHNERRYAGLIAQEVREVLPEVVFEDAQGTLSVAYGNMVALLVEAIRELKDEVRALKNQGRS